VTVKQFFLEGVDFIKQILINRHLILDLTRRDFKTRYSQHLFGLSWAVLEPISIMAILWVVFSLLYASATHSGYPFVSFLLCGIIPYDFFNKTINKGTRAITSFSFLIKQVDFKIAILPLIYILSELVILILILVVSFGIFSINHVPPSWYWFQLIYYIFAMCVLLLGVCWFTSSVLPFFPDIYIIISIVMRILFFLTPIFWDINRIPADLLPFLKINPLFYLVEGFRMSILYHKPFWSDLHGTLFFWGVTLFFLILGVYVFKKLRPQFADVL